MNSSRASSHCLAAGALMASILLLACPVLLAVESTEENSQVTQLLSEAREKAAGLSRDADEMESLTRSEVSWQTHASMLETMKVDA
jgi:hypothetical protein